MQPVLYNVKSFDADQQNCRFKFTWSGPQVQGSWLDIYINGTEENVYSKKNMETGSLEHVIYAGSENGLENGVTYRAKIRVGYDVYPEDSAPYIGWSEYSDSIVFTCYSIPEFTITANFDTPGTSFIRNSYVVATINYSQEQHIPLAAYNVILKNEDKKIVQQSGEIYIQDSSVSSITYIFDGLENGAKYLLQAVGQTRGTDYTRIRMDTGEDPRDGSPIPLLEIRVAYISPAFSSGINVINKPEEGGVLFTSNYVSVEGRGENPVSYIDGTKANLINNKVYFDDNYVAKKDFDIGLLVEGFSVNKPIIEFRANTTTTMPNAVLFYREVWIPLNDPGVSQEEKSSWPSQYITDDAIMVGFFELLVDTDYGFLVIDSKYFKPTGGVSSKPYQIWIERLNDYYSVTTSEKVPNK